MTLDEIKQLLKTEPYDFLRNDQHLGSNIILLTLGGSHAYGTETEHSDLDIRGIAINTKKEILLGQDFEQVVERNTDTVIYSLKKIVNLLKSVNPNVVELLGNLYPGHYLYLSKIGQSLLDNKDMFLSQRAIESFGGYAEGQLRRLESKAHDSLEQKRREEYILKSINRSRNIVVSKYHEFDGSVDFYIDDAVTEGLDAEIYIDTHLNHYPLRDLKALLNEFGNILNSYSKLGQRNNKAILHEKISKHCMHLLRLFMMCIDILEKGEINTYRVNEHDLLMMVRNDYFLGSDGVPNSAFYDLVNDYTKRMDYAAANTSLPLEPDHKRINDWLCWANELVVTGQEF